ncbi:serine hydroxymethyltransferase [Halocatena pleomorpha]|uniref:Serine hydroxymethyltransferase n=1 Tax=Halocatena pleomorpha TaxID=1785090 RepID=A0A3P3R714_9EURY|nr:serine hydroxymethyltransferase [Halocatena pleomorpha]RRJ29226.1 serine hydroxymethyltransferase [Halocatena pleomorpha]
MEYNHVRETDPEVADALVGEVERQRETLAMIASENHVSRAVLEAQGSTLTNKYAEGYPDARYYGGCECADTVEQLAIDRATELWGAEYVNVQPHSGSQANMGVYLAALDPGDKILSLDLTHGGHLSHGHPKNFAGQVYEVEQYEVDSETGYIDYEALAAHATEFEPDMIVSGYSAYPRQVEWERIQEIATSVDAYHLADIAHITGLVAAGEHPSPVGVADFVTGSTHKTIRAGRGGIIMSTEEHADAIDSAIIPGMQGGPLMHNIAGKAVGFKEALQPEFEEYAAQVVANASALGERLAEHGLSLVSGGTDTHLVLVDLRDSHPDTTGKKVEGALEDVGIVLNANTVPGETRSPFVASGIRAGTPALTTRGFDTTAIEQVADCIARVVDSPDDADVKDDVAEDVQALCAEHPLYE